ncbi:MAG: hypothetical protein HYZ44_11045 [Bacteroidetes bacterium]|nr:hypothetical protein [Bacteroidota bacterium]
MKTPTVPTPEVIIDGRPILKSLRVNHLLMAHVFVSVFILMMGCEPEIEPIRQFITYKGDHYSWPRVSETLQSKTMAFEARFNETAKYDFKDLSIQSDKNKLMGFCDSNSLPHDNSARFAWQWFNDRLEIYAYCYANGVRLEQFVGVVELNEYNHYEIEMADGQYIFRLNNLPAVTVKRGNASGMGAYYKLWPYFGGHIAAPHDVIIDIKSIY